MSFVAKRRTIILIWLAWALIMVGYQFYVRARFEPKRPDYALFWTPTETAFNSQNNKPYLLEPFLNQHVSWDSEYYLSIAVGGYDDPAMRAIPPNYDWERMDLVGLKARNRNWITFNHAFFPFYPYVIRVMMVPLRIFGPNDIATATLAGVLVSMLGTLAAMLALADLAGDDGGDSDGIRAAFYLVIWPAGMFLAEVYTEGLFLGLSFGALALARRQQWIVAAILAACATWARAAGGLLLLPMAWYWWRGGGLNRLWRDHAWIEVGKLLLIASPVFAYLIWNAALGESFHVIESRWFSRGLLRIGQSWHDWKRMWDAMWESNLQMRAYYLVEFGAIGFGLAACVLMLRRRPALSLYSLAVIVFSLTSGSAQGMQRYVLAAPAIFLVLARWGRHEAFDRAWTLASVLLMGVFAIMFSYDFWAG
jgi:Gpi18-like mannosyltransferase